MLRLLEERRSLFFQIEREDMPEVHCFTLVFPLTSLHGSLCLHCRRNTCFFLLIFNETLTDREGIAKSLKLTRI